MSFEDATGVTLVPRTEKLTPQQRMYTVVGISEIDEEPTVLWVYASSAAAAVRRVKDYGSVRSIAVLHGFIGRADIKE